VRSYRDVWLWLGGLLLALWAFLLAVAMAYFLKEPHYSLFGNGWMIGACLAFAAAFGCLFNLTRPRTVPPWIRPGFPDVTVEIGSLGSTETERESSSGLDVPALLRSYNVRMANLETGNDAKLTVMLYAKLVAGSWGRAAEAVCPPPAWALPPVLGLNPLSMPVLLAPGDSVAGQLVYEIPGYCAKMLAEPFEARLEITDDRSGKKMSVPAALGLYDVSAMTPVAGGIEILRQGAGRPDGAAEADGGRPAARPGPEEAVRSGQG